MVSVPVEPLQILERRKLLDRIEWNLYTAESLCQGEREVREASVLTAEDLVRQVETVLEHPMTGAALARMRDVQFSADHEARLMNAALLIAKRTADLQNAARAGIDQLLQLLIEVLPAAVSDALAVECLRHRRKPRREAALKALRTRGVDGVVAKELFDRYRASGNQELLKFVARFPRAIAESDPRFLLDHLEEQYWRMRVVESLLTADQQRAQALAPDFPHEFLWAVGRARHEPSLPIVGRLLDEKPYDLEVVSLCAYAYGQLRVADHLDAIRAILERERDRHTSFRNE